MLQVASFVKRMNRNFDKVLTTGAVNRWWLKLPTPDGTNTVLKKNSPKSTILAVKPHHTLTAQRSLLAPDQPQPHAVALGPERTPLPTSS